MVLLSFLGACSHIKQSEMQVQHIPINLEKNKVLNLSSFCDSIEIVPLQTTEENLIGEIGRIIYSNGEYYMRVTHGYRDGQIHIYDSCGNFISKIFRLGNGPGEYMNLEDFYLTEEKNIKIASFFKIINYDSIGNFLNEKRIKQPAKEMYPLQDNKYLKYNFNISLHGNKLMSIADKNDGIIESFFEVGKKEVNKSDLTYDSNAFSSYNDTIYFHYPYCDTIYTIIENEVKPKYFIDYGKKQIPSDLLDEKDDVMARSKKLKTLPTYNRSYSLGITSAYLCIGSIDKDYNGYVTFYFKHSNHMLTGQKIKDDIYLKGNIVPIKSRYLPWVIDNNNLLWIVEPRYLIKGYKNYRSHLSEPERADFQARHPKLAKICSSLKEDDNPVLLRIHIKNQ